MHQTHRTFILKSAFSSLWCSHYVFPYTFMETSLISTFQGHAYSYPSSGQSFSTIKQVGSDRWSFRII